MGYQTGTLENSFKRPDKVQTINKESLRIIKVIRQKQREIIYDSSDVCIYGRDNYGDPTHPYGTKSDFTITSTRYYNDNNEFIRPFIYSDDLIDYIPENPINDNNDNNILDNNDNNIIGVGL